jgi:hypothetical protein
MISSFFLRKFVSVPLTLLSIVFFVSVNCAAQQPKVLAPHKPVPRRITSAQPQPFANPSLPRSLLGGLWMIDGSMKSYLHITNDLATSPLSVTPILWLSNGSRLPLPLVKIEPSGTVVLSINQALADQGIAPFATLSGYVEIEYQWPWDALCATVRNVDVAHSLIFNYGLPLTSPPAHAVQPTEQATEQTLEGLWWKQEPDVTGFVALINTGSQPISANLAVTDGLNHPISRQSVTISPHGTKMLDLAGLPHTAGSVGGLRVQFTGQPNDLIASGGLRDDATGYSATIGLASSPAGPSQPSTATFAELGLMTGPADPMLSFPAGTAFTPYSIARNISNQPIIITPNLWWMAGGAAKTAALAQFTLAPYESRNLNVPVLLAAAGLKEYSGSVNLVLDTAGNAPAGSILLSAGSVDQKNTYVFQIVPSSVKESIAKNLSYWSTASGDDTMVTLWNPADEAQDLMFTLLYFGGHYRYPMHLQPRATQMFNVSEILHTAAPDDEGNVIPSGIHEGSAVLSGSQGEAEHILVAVEAGTYNVQKATCGGYCATCDGAVGSWTSGSFDVLVGDTQQLTLTVLNHNQTQYDDTGVATWTSPDTSVATVGTFGSGTPGLVNGVAAGSVSISAHDNSYPGYVSGCGFPNPNPCPIYTGGVGGSAQGKVHVPTSVSVVSGVLAGSTTQCSSSEYGAKAEITYQVKDQDGNQIKASGMQPQEIITNFFINGAHQNDPAPEWANLGDPTDSNGQFKDTPLGVCAGFAVAETATQQISVLYKGTRYPASGAFRTNSLRFTGLTAGHGRVCNGTDSSCTGADFDVSR